MFHRVLIWSLCCWGALTLNDTSTEPYSLRLVGGDTQCRGELQIKRAGHDWTGVIPWVLPLELGHRVCAELDCGAAVTMKRINVPKREAVDFNYGKCGNAPLSQCFGSTYAFNDSLELNCLDSVRLVSGRSHCSGLVQIRDQSMGQSWTWVCEGALDSRGAEVLCRELGCGAPLLQGALSPLGQTFHCEGHESALTDCPCNHTRTNPETCSRLRLSCSELRLVEGPGRCEGTVELNHRGEWRRARSLYSWGTEEAAAVCRDLDCGAALYTTQSKYLPRTDVWAIHTPSVKYTAVRDSVVDMGIVPGSHRDVHVTCLDSVRLVSGQSQCSGSLQIQDQSLDQSWIWVCEGALDSRGAEVLCRELGCGAPLLQRALSPLGQMFHCEGRESSLMDCPRNQTRTNPEACSRLNLTCSEPFRLVGGAHRCEGIVEVYHKAEWRRARPLFGSWNLKTASAICRGLSCGSALSTRMKKGLDRKDTWTMDSYCLRRESVRDCISYGSSDSDGLEVVCSDSVLVSGRSQCSGSLQIRDQFLDQSWTWVCEGALDSRGVEVLCRELGCGAPLLQGTLSPLGQMFHCEGHESALMDCPRNQTRTNPETCSRLKFSCSEPVRLVGGSRRCEGIVELLHSGEWRGVKVFYDFQTWRLKDAEALCQDLDCGSAVYTEFRNGFTLRELWDIHGISMEETTLREWVYEGTSGDVGVELVCADSVRLVSRQTSCSGSLQIRDRSLHQPWTWVCEGALDSRGAEVLCKELGCGAPLLQGTLSPLGHTFHCEGRESSLMDCPRNQTRTNPETCSRLNLTCSEPVRLVGGASRCEGTVELNFSKEWRRVKFSGYVNPQRMMNVLCQDLGCGSIVSLVKKQDFPVDDLWEADIYCANKATLKECVHKSIFDSSDGVEVVCSGHQGAT